MKDTEHMIYHSYMLESLCIDDSRRRDCDYVSRDSQIPEGILHRNRSHLVPTPVGPPAGISGCTPVLELENKASIKGPDVLFSDNVPRLRNTPEKIYYNYKNIFPSLGSLDNKVACHYVLSRLAYFNKKIAEIAIPNATLMLTTSALRDHVYSVH